MREGSLFTGYGGLSRAACDFYGATTAWVSDIDPGANLILAHRYPDVPNLGDITQVDWSQVEPVDMLTGGFPCQDLSPAGKRAGLRPGTRSGLWTHMAYAISQLRPRLVVIENVRGLLSARAHSDVEPCPWCMGEAGHRGPDLRALGAVLGDLAQLGYDAQWQGLRAADVGAPHGRYRIFILATDAQGQPGRIGHRDDVRTGRGAVGRQPTTGRGTATDTERGGWDGRPGELGTRRRPEPPYVGDVATDPGKPGPQGDGSAEQTGRTVTAERSTADAASDGRNKRRPQSARIIGRPHAPISSAANPNPPVERRGATGRHYGLRAPRLVPINWGAYEPAVRRWESVLGRPAPAPTEPSEGYQRRLERRLQRRDPRPVGMRGSLAPNRSLSPQFVEWMMGLPEGHVTDVPGLSRNAQLKALGNGVVPQQCYAALQIMTERIERQTAA